MTDKRIWELLAKQFAGEINPEELHELEGLLGRQTEKAPYGELLSDLHGLGVQPDPDERLAKERSLAAIRSAIRKQVTPESESEAFPVLVTTAAVRTRIRWAFGLAAVLLALPIALLLLHPSRISTTFSDTAKNEALDKIITKSGSKTLITLPDSSTVMLSSACQFSYNKNFGVRKREMHLTGEAWFDIHSNPDMPLVVHAGSVEIKVLGTTFNIKANQGDSFVEATLIKGAIEVSLRSDPERRILLRPGEKIQIRQDSVSASGTTGRNIAPDMITVSKLPSTILDSGYVQQVWQKEKLQFHKESFGSLIHKMESRYDVRIVLADSSLHSLLFTGSFDRETLDEALQALKNSAPFNYRKDGDTITITRRKY